MVEQRAVALGNRFQFLEDKGELARVEPVDLLDLLLFGRVAAVVREVVVAVGDADLVDSSGCCRRWRRRTWRYG